MKVLFVSDRVVPELYDDFNPSLVHGVEAIVSCGDLSPEYLIFLREKIGVPLYYVCGNHDIRYGDKIITGCLNIHAQFVKLGRCRLLGLSGSRWYSGGVHQYHEAEMRAIIRGLWLPLTMGGVDIVVTHAPPRKIHDKEDRCHRGFKSFNRFIDKYQPCWLVHGHIHAQFSSLAERMTIVGSTRVVNAYEFVVLDL